MSDDLKKSINKGRLKTPAIIGIGVLIAGAVTWLIFGGEGKHQRGEYVRYKSTAVSQTQINKNKKNPDVILYKDFVTIKGERYQIRLNKDKFEVLKGDQWVSIEDVIGKDGTIIMQDGKLIFITPDGRKVALDTGDILNSEGELKQIDDDGELVDFINDRLYLKNGVMKYLDDDGIEKDVNDGDIITIDGKAYKMTDGVLKDMGSLFKNYVAQKDPVTGKIKYYRKGLNGDLIPISEDELSNGSLVKMDGKDYEYLNGNLVPLTKEYLAKRDKDGNLKYYLKGDLSETEVPPSKIANGSIIELDGKQYEWIDGDLKPLAKEIKGADELSDINDYDYVVEMENGEPAYYQKIGDEWIPIRKELIPNKAIIYHNGKPYILGKDGKLIPFKLEKGQSFIKGGRAYTVGKNGLLVPLKDGDVVAKDKGFYIVDGSNIEPLTAENAKLHDEKQGLAFVDGKPYILGKGGQKRAITEDDIVFRGGKPYKYINGRFVELSLQELEAIKKAENKRKLAEKKAQQENERINQKKDTGIQNVKVKVLDDSAWFEALSADASVNTIKNESKNSNAKEISNKQTNSDKLTNQLFDSIGQEQTPYQQQNNQAQKKKFLEEHKNSEVPTDDKYQKSPYTLLAGTIIDASFITGVNTDQPGTVWGLVTRDVYDTKTGNYLLIPQGSTVLGVYNSEVTEGAETVLMVWNKLILPDGRQISLEGLQGLDLQGFSGIKGEVDNHWESMFYAVAGMSIFSAGIQYGAGLTTTGGDNLNGLQLIGASIAQQLGELGMQVFQRILNRQPTISLPAGRAFKIGITHNLVFSDSYKWGNTMRLINR